MIRMKKNKFLLLLMVFLLALTACSGKNNTAEEKKAAVQEKAGKAAKQLNPGARATGRYIVGIIGPMPEEIKILHDDMKVKSSEKAAGMTFYKGTLKGQNIVLVQSGIGKVNAAAAAQILISRFHVNALINSGIAGAVDPKLKLGDIVISSETVQHDMDETAKGYDPGVVPGMDTSVFRADPKLISLAEKAAKDLTGNMKVYTGRIATGDQFIADDKKKNWIYTTFKPYVVDMEGAAVGQVAYINQVPYVIVRSASDDAGNKAVMKWEDFKSLAVKHSSAIIEGVLQNMK